MTVRKNEGTPSVLLLQSDLLPGGSSYAGQLHNSASSLLVFSSLLGVRKCLSFSGWIMIAHCEIRASNMLH